MARARCGQRVDMRQHAPHTAHTGTASRLRKPKAVAPPPTHTIQSIDPGQPQGQLIGPALLVLGQGKAEQLEEGGVHLDRAGTAKSNISSSYRSWIKYLMGMPSCPSESPLHKEVHTTCSYHTHRQEALSPHCPDAPSPPLPS